MSVASRAILSNFLGEQGTSTKSVEQNSAARVKERFILSRETNVPEGTFFKKTQDSLLLIHARNGKRS